MLLLSLFCTPVWIKALVIIDIMNVMFVKVYFKPLKKSFPDNQVSLIDQWVQKCMFASLRFAVRHHTIRGVNAEMGVWVFFCTSRLFIGKTPWLFPALDTVDTIASNTTFRLDPTPWTWSLNLHHRPGKTTLTSKTQPVHSPCTIDLYPEPQKRKLDLRNNH